MNAEDRLQGEGKPHVASDLTANTTAPDLKKLSLDARQKPAAKGASALPHKTRKRAADRDLPRGPANASPHTLRHDLTSSTARPRELPLDVRPQVAGEKRSFDPHNGSTSSPGPGLYSSDQEETWSAEAVPQDGASPEPMRPAVKPPPSHFNPASPMPGSNAAAQPGLIQMSSNARWPQLLLQPDSRPISQEQLAAEVKSIYAGLTMVETKCIHVDKAQAAAALEPESSQSKLAPDHWQALIALHRTLLHEHHDFFLASQHPSASPALRRLAAKYSMPARMWKHGIHSFLELLRHRLPDSMEYMLAFIYLAYQMMALLYETVPTFEDTWIECLGDLGRYRMAIEDEDLRDREIWAAVARSWYSKAADKNPQVGRLYHHLAILARPNALQQLYYYARSLACVQPFLSAKESVLTLFDPIVERQSNSSQAVPNDIAFIKAHGLLFKGRPLNQVHAAIDEFCNGIDANIGRITAKFKEQGVQMAITNLSSMYNYGATDSPLRLVYQEHAGITSSLQGLPHPAAAPVQGSSSGNNLRPLFKAERGTDYTADFNVPAKNARFQVACHLNFVTMKYALRRIGDRNVLLHVHAEMVFIASLGPIRYDMSAILRQVPWSDLVTFLNVLAKSENLEARSSLPTFAPGEGDNRPLPEDYLIRGQIWAQSSYFPTNWFDLAQDEEERCLEAPSVVKARTDRVLYLGTVITEQHPDYMAFDRKSCRWTIPKSMFGTGQANDTAMVDVDAEAEAERQDAMVVDLAPPEDGDGMEIIDEEDSPEMVQLRQRTTRLSPTGSSKGNGIFQSHFTILVCTTQMVLSQNVLKSALTRGDYDLVVPSTVIVELNQLLSGTNANSGAATEALDMIKAGAKQGRSIRVLNEQGKLFRER